MPDRQEIWQILFNETPVFFRWLFGVLTLGMFTLASILYKWHRDDMSKMEARIMHMELKLDARLEHIYDTLLEIARNTRP